MHQCSKIDEELEISHSTLKKNLAWSTQSGLCKTQILKEMVSVSSEYF